MDSGFDMAVDNTPGRPVNVWLPEHYSHRCITDGMIEDGRGTRRPHGSGMAIVRSIFGKIESMPIETRYAYYDDNWLFVGTSGVHGTYYDLDRIAESMTLPPEPEGIRESDLDDREWFFNRLTVLIVQPRLVSIRYGEIDVTPEDLPFLRSVVSETIRGVIRSQTGSIDPSFGARLTQASHR